MNYSSRFFLYGPFGLFATLMLGLMGYWWLASGIVSKKLDTMNGQEVAPGIHFSFSKKSMSGFPFRIDGELDGLRVEIATSHGPAIWESDRFAFHSLTYEAGQFIFEAAGKQNIEWHNNAGQLHSYSFLPGSLRASAILNGHQLVRFDLDVLNADSPDISASRVQMHMRRDPKIEGLDLFFSADNVNFSPDEQPAFGPKMQSFAVNALVSPGSSFDSLLAGHGEWRAAAQDWHNSHGGMRINNITINWGVLNTSGSGAMAVDDLHLPIGALNFTIDDWQTLIQKIQKRDGTSETGVGLASALSDSLSAARQNDPKPMVVRLNFKEGLVFVGTMPADFLSPLF